MPKDSKQKQNRKDYRPQFEPKPVPASEEKFDGVYGTRYVKVPIGFLFNKVTIVDTRGKTPPRLMERGAALLLAFLAGWRKFCKRQQAKHREHFDGWFYCTAKTIQRRINFTPDAQQKLLARLHSYGLVGMEMRGKAPKHRRYICINIPLLMEITRYDRQNGG